MYITLDFDKHIVFPMCAFFGKSAIDVHAAERNQDKICENKKNVNEMLLPRSTAFPLGAESRGAPGWVCFYFEIY